MLLMNYYFINLPKKREGSYFAWFLLTLGLDVDIKKYKNMPSTKKKNLIILLLIGCFSLIQPVNAQVPDEIIVCLKSGNAKTLSGYFNQNVELVVPDNDNVYSKAQAQLIVNEFFNSYAPQSFSVIHQGGKEGAQYVIGNLATKKGSFRVYFLLKKNNGKDYIHQLRIEKQE